MATPNAPQTLQDLKELLKSDNKVKVAGKISTFCFGSLSLISYEQALMV